MVPLQLDRWPFWWGTTRSGCLCSGALLYKMTFLELPVIGTRRCHWERPVGTRAVESTADSCFPSHSLHSTCSRRGCLFNVNCHLCPCPMFSRSLSFCLVCAVEFLGIMWLLCTLEKFFYSDLCYSICDYLRKPNFDAVCVCWERESVIVTDQLLPFMEHPSFAGHWALDVIISKTYNSTKRWERVLVKSG